MKLFTMGPVEMYERTKTIAARQLPYFRTPEFSGIMLETETMLKKAMHAPQEAKALFLTASGSGAMEAVVANCFNPSDKLLIIAGGNFGERFVQLAELYQIPYEAVRFPFGVTLTQAMLAPYENGGFTALLVNIHETGTGQLYDKEMLSAFCRRNHMYFIVDAISSFLADEYDVEKYSIDATIISTQKGLALAPGMAVVVLSERLWKEKVIHNTVRNMYFDFCDAYENMKRGQTPFTPAVGVVYQLHDMLGFIMDMGVENKIAHTQALCADFRTYLPALGLSMPAFPCSAAMTTVMFGDIPATLIYETLKKDFDIFVTPSGGALKDVIVRVGHIGNLHVTDNRLLISALREVLDSIRKRE